MPAFSFLGNKWSLFLKSDLLLAVNQLAAERNLPKPVVLRAVEFALAAA